MEKKPVFFFLPVLVLFLSISRICSARIVSNQTTDQDALVAFKTAIISDPYKILVKNWSSDASVCNWIGVSCSHQRVTALNFSGFSFQGTVAPSLGNLTFLSSLDLRSNNFTGFIPQELSHLHRLQVIDVGFNSFTGEIPSWFGTLPELEFIFMDNNKFSGSIPPSLGDCSKLRILNLAYNFLGGIFNLSSIQKIDLTGNSLSGGLPKDMCNSIPRLRGLHLSLNLLSGEIPFNIYKCSELQDLSLSFNHFNSSIPSSIGRLANIKTLFLGVNSFQGGVPVELCNLSRLESLSIRGAYLTGQIPSFIFMSSLKQVDLANNSLSGSLPVALYHKSSQSGAAVSSKSAKWTKYGTQHHIVGELPAELGNLNLVEINVRNNVLTGAIPFSMFNISTCGAFSSFNLWRISKPGIDISIFINKLPIFAESRSIAKSAEWCTPASIGNFSTSLQLSNLGDFYVSNNTLHGSIPACFGELKSLRGLYLDSNKLESNVNLWNLKDLLGLNLSSNILSGFLPSEIGNLKVVRNLDLSWNQFSGNVPSAIGGALSLVSLSLAHNKFRGSIPQSLGDLKGLESLDLPSLSLLSSIL
ncbi:UNVERIFIED_CONTAM: Receptor protein kinase-like protein ZAR1 [Sesamum radiatum]|uniref:Receptor protein kinase-like protein ZAR1 n=1 Tax=Sesamum radiatum TaxID=300843 RepID=A0AAW2QDG8_SESRA